MPVVYTTLVQTGIDIVSIDKFRNLTKADYEHWRHVFSESEWAYAWKDDLAPLHLSGIFAAKEALMKATDRAGLDHFRDFTIEHTPSGRPVVAEVPEYSISISHDAGVAVAVALTP